VCVCVCRWLWDSRPLDLALWKISVEKTSSHWCACRAQCECWDTHSWFVWPSDQVTKRPVKKMMNNIEATILNGKFSKWLSDQVTKWPVTKWWAVPCGDCNEILHSCSVHAQKGLSPSDQVVSDQVTKWPSDQWKRWWTILSKLQFKMENSLSD
jgi:hypothetical protein